MIWDALGEQARYRNWHPGLAAGFDFLLEHVKANLAPGKYAIDGERVFALVSEYETHGPETSQPEAHRKYFDIQTLVEGRERIGWSPRVQAGQVVKPYDLERDIEFFDYAPETLSLELRTGHFAVFFPGDVHHPCLQIGAPTKVRKIVIKAEVAR